MKAKSKATVKISKAKGKRGKVSIHNQADDRVLYLASLIDNISDALISTDRQFNILGWNAAAENMYGWTETEVTGHPLQEFVQSEYIDITRGDALEAILKQGIWQGEVTQQHRDGRRIPVLASVSQVKDDTGNPIGFVAINRDITERKRVESQLRQSEERFSKAFHSTPTALILARLSDRRIEYVNESFLNLVGYLREEVIGQIPEELTPFPNPEQIQKFREILAETKQIRNLETAIRTKSGDIREVLFSVDIIQLDQQPYMLTTMVDITQRKQAERQVIQMKRLYATLSQVNQTIVRVKSQAELYQSICDVALKFGELTFAWIGLLDEATGDIQPVAASGLEVEIARWPFPIMNIHGKPFLNGIITEAMHTSKAVTSEDVQTDERTTALQAVVQKFGFHSLAAVPFRLRGKTMGVLVMISVERGVFKAQEELKLLDEMSLDISFALDNMESERIKRQWADAFEHCAHSIAIELPSRNLLTCNPAFARAHGSTIQEISSMPTLSLYAPQDHKQIKGFIAQADREGSIKFEANKVRADGSIYPVEMDLVSVQDGSGNLLYRVATQQDITERKRAERAVIEKERQMTALVTSLDDIVFEFDEQGVYLNIWAAEESKLAQPKAQMLGRLINDVLGEEVGGPFTEAVRRAITEGRTESIEYSLEVIGGQRWFSADVNPVVAQDGSHQTASMLVRDITERKQAETELQEAREIFQKIFTTSPVAIALSRISDRTIVDLNAAMESLLGYSRQEMMGNPSTNFDYWADQQARQRAFEILLNEGTLRDYEFSFKTKSGAIGQALNYTEAFDQRGETYLLSVFVDITERKQAEEKLRGSEENYRLLVAELDQRVKQRTTELQDLYDNAPAGYHSLDAKGCIVKINQTELNWLGYTRDEILGRPIGSLLTPASLDIFQQQFPVFRTSGRLTGLELEFTRKDGSTFPVLVNASAIHDAQKNFVISRSTVIDNTEHKKAEDALHQANAELEHANRAKDEFLATMSHELRTPLNSILGLSESLLEQRRDPLSEHQHQSLEIIQYSGQHLLELINDILDLSKIDAGKFDIYPQVIEVSALCRSSLAFVKQQAIQKSISLTYQEDEAVSKIQADPRRLKQILVNLLTNAVKFTPQHGNVTLQVQGDAARDRIQFSVIDTGIGISAESLQRLFQPFVQVDSSLNRQFEGTGLGLALVQKLTDLQGGSVEVESEVGRGSRFTINLPWDKEDVAEKESIEWGGEALPVKISEKSNPPSKKEAARGIVLLAEDNPANTLTIADYLENHGYQIVFARDGLEAIERAEETHPDLILMDIQMPVLDGLESIRRLRANLRFASIPIIALTALAMPGDRERCLQVGATEYMSKPVSLKSLAKLIDDLLRHQNT